MRGMTGVKGVSSISMVTLSSKDGYVVGMDGEVEAVIVAYVGGWVGGWSSRRSCSIWIRMAGLVTVERSMADVVESVVLESGVSEEWRAILME